MISQFVTLPNGLKTYLNMSFDQYKNPTLELSTQFLEMNSLLLCNIKN